MVQRQLAGDKEFAVEISDLDNGLFVSGVAFAVNENKITKICDVDFPW